MRYKASTSLGKLLARLVLKGTLDSDTTPIRAANLNADLNMGRLHMAGNSIGIIRAFYRLGVRYVGEIVA